jgi:3',5'-cyclic AMP phosphodiesterase CpdA
MGKRPESARVARPSIRETSHGRSGRAAEPLPSRAVLRDSITAAVENLQRPGSPGRARTPGFGPGLVAAAVAQRHPLAEVDHRALAEDLLREAREALDHLPSDAMVAGGFVHNDNLALSLVLSQIAEKQVAPKKKARGRPGVMRQDITGTDQYELLDTGWWASVANRLFHAKAPFISHSGLADFRVELADENPTVAMVGDWGTGLPSSREIARHMASVRPTLTIHLGDVYYSGTPHEVETRFLPDWPVGSAGTFALNSNHEMYAGGEGYFGRTLKQPVFARHQKASYFCLSLPGWQIIGLDSAYAASDFLYQKGRLSDAQLQWLSAQLAEGARRGQRSIVLTHHNPIDVHGKIDDGLLDSMLRAAQPHPFDFWYWAHEHVGARYAISKPLGDRRLGRCVGHGGVPYAPEHAGDVGHGVRIDWTETELAGDPQEPRRAKNGFVFLELNSKDRTLRETFIDEFGAKKAGETF